MKSTGCASSVIPINNKPLRVAVIEPSGRLYGSEYCLLDIVAGLPRAEFDWRVFLPQDQGFDKLLQQHEIECDFSMPANLGEMSGFKKTFVYGRILCRLRRLKPDLIYVNQTGSLRAAAIYARVLRLPIVCQVQTLEDARWLSGRPSLHRQVQAFICNSEFIAKETKVDADKMCILYQGIADQRVARARQHAEQRRRLERKGDLFTIGILGRIAVSKGHYLLIEAAKRLQSSHPDFRYVVIGEGLTSADTKDYKAAVREQGLDSIFEFRGYRQDIEEELARVDLLAIPSIAEPLGRVLFDAAEYGVPVVISDAGGLGELGKRFDVGLHFRSEDSAALAKTMVTAAEEYSETLSAFHQSGVAMLERLAMQPYLDTIGRILRCGASGESCSAVWLGEAATSE